MRFSEYIKDKILICLLHLLCMILLMGFFYITGYNRNAAALILIFWWIILGIWIVTGYYRRKKYFDRAEHILENVDQRYLLGELLPASPYLEDRIYRELIRRSNKSVIERIRMLEDEQNDYRDYIESWVHEIKAPITSIQLACENHKDEVTRQIGLENQRIENDVDMVLYYARMEKVYKDYMIEETDLGKAASEVLMKNKYYLISNGVRGEVECPDFAYTDKKWILFILNQLMLNSVKYKSENPKVHPYIHIYTERYGHGVRLIVEDNGSGIREEEMSRIFEKGFTGSNGRNGKKSTGMGLYLCRRLCEKLGIAIEAESVRGDRVSFCVQKGEFVGIMGASGSGKTTLLNMLSTIDRVTAGHIYYGETDITELSDEALAEFRKDNLGFIFQDYNLLDTLTIEENIVLAMTLHSKSKREIQEKCDHILKLLDIEEIRDKFPYQVSGGQKQRCACARAMIHRPKLILADEPTGALDSKAAQMLLETFRKMNHDMHSTILMVTHDAFSASYCSRILFLKDGKIFHELVRGVEERREFLNKILDVLSLTGGELSDVR